jgi:hypothetical protein
MVLLITYGINQEITRQNMVKAIKEIGLWAKLSESSYAINSDLTVEQVFSKLKPLLDSNDTLYVITLKSPYTGVGPIEVNDWIATNLTF